MSAICALYHFDGSAVTKASVTRMLDAMAGFGSAASSWTPERPDSPVGLGCRPVRVTPEDRFHHPPVHSADGRLVLVADARLDNRSELGNRLGWRAADAAQRSDPDFILAAYQAWGTRCPRELLGDFAFLVWDQHARQLFGARDGMGLRVLFYQATPARIGLATLAQALLSLEGGAGRLNEQKVAESLVLIQDPTTTFFEGVKRLAPGQWLTAGPRGIELGQFWSPRPSRPLVLGSDAEYAEGFAEVFGRAVQARIRASGPVGITLSGGLDSTAVTAFAAPLLAAQGQRLRAYHAAPRQGFAGAVGSHFVADESAEVEAVAQRFPNLDLWISRTDGKTPFDSPERLFGSAGLPVRNPSAMPWGEAIYLAAQADGVTVMLNGNPGNNTISYDGVRSLRDLTRQGRWRVMWRELQALARATQESRRDLLKEHALLPFLPGWLSRPSSGPRNLREARRAVAEFSAINPAFADFSRVAERVLAQGFAAPRIRRAGSVEHRVAALSSPGDGPDFFNGIRAWFGMETREPASDLRVVEYCLAIPATQFLQGGRTRSLLRRVLADRLPRQVVDRDTFGAQGADWSESIPAMRGAMVAELDQLDRCATARRCLDLARLRSLVVGMPDQPSPGDQGLYVDLLLRGLMMGRFIRWFEATYS